MNVLKKTLRTVVLVGVVAVPPAVAYATETIAYKYDAKGRLITVERTGTVNSGVKAQYNHDKADNRTTIVVSGSTNPTPP